MALILVSDKRSFCYSFLSACTRIVKGIRRRHASGKTVVSTGAPGGIPTGEGENSVTKPEGRSRDGFRVTSVLERPKTKA
jgi:hypothetical protein